MSLISALQLSTLPMNEVKLDYYAKICNKKNIRLIVLGEYVLNNFFKELETLPKNMIKEQSNHKIKTLQDICKKYNLTIIAPIVRFYNKKIYKCILKATPKSMRYFNQYFYINYKHWNEEKFFHQENSEYVLPTFTHEGIKYGIIMGYELHFDHVFKEVDSKKVDALLVPSVSTFESKDRWDELLKMRAFTHNIYILRVNRIGLYKHELFDWRFYGHSALFNPHGYIEECLNDEEAMMVVDISKANINKARNMWGWRKTLVKKGLV